MLNKKKVYNNLKKKGFIDSKNLSKDHKYLEFHYNNIKICFTKISHGSKPKDLEDYLIQKMSNQCKLKKKDFENLVNCPLSKKDYLKILQEKNII